MNSRERFVVYGALVVLGVMNVTALLDDGGAHAWADLDPAKPGLGPAESLTLTGEDGQVVLRERDGRLAWGDNEHAEAFSIAFVHVGRAVGPLLEADHYADEYKRMEEEIRAADEEIGRRIEAFVEEHKDVTPEDPEAARIQRTYQELVQERERWRLEGSQRLGQLAASHIEQAYRDLVAAVEVVAERRKIDIVFRFIPTADEFETPNPQQAHVAIRARIALRYPPGLDITDDVLKELAVEG